MVSIKRPKLDDLISVSMIHTTLFKQTLTTRLGLDFVKKIYRTVYGDNNCKIFVAYEDERPLGFITATENFKETNENISKNISFRYKIALIPKFIFNPFLVVSFLVSAILHNQIKRYLGQNAIYVMTIGVDIHSQKKGIGKKLMAKLISEYGSMKKRVVVDTEANNKKAVAFYKSIGFKIEREILGNIIFGLDLT